MKLIQRTHSTGYYADGSAWERPLAERRYYLDVGVAIRIPHWLYQLIDKYLT